jgi:hypothetical protein
MSGIVGSKFNIRGSGLVGSLGTDGQHMLSSGAGVSNVFETVAAGGNSPSFKVYKTSSQTSLSPSTQHKITWQTEEWDTDGAFDLSNDKFVVPTDKDGKYIFSGHFYSDGWGNTRQFDDYRITWYKNGAEQERLIMVEYGHTQYQGGAFVFYADLDAADYVELYFWSDQGSGTTGNLVGVAGPNSPTFWGGYKIG